MRIPIYPAGPLGFSEAGRYFYYGAFLPMLEEIGYEPLDPWKLTDQSIIDAALSAPEGPEQKQKWVEANKIISENNATAIRKSRIVVACLDGTDVDSGTAAEIADAASLGKPVIGYRGDFRPCGDNPGCIVNLQVEHYIHKNGGEIARSLATLRPILERWHLVLHGLRMIIQ